MTNTLAERIELMLTPVAQRQGVELVAVEIAGATKHPVVRIYLDREGGIDIDAIVEANRWISEALDAEDPVAGAYDLEVSSPGLDRPLRRIADFDRFRGQTAVVKTTPIGGRGKFTGTITGTDADTVLLEADGETFRIPLGAISKAHLKGDVDFGQKGADDK